MASLTSDCPGLEAVRGLAVVGRSWHPTRQPSQVQGVRWKVVEEGEDTCVCCWSTVVHHCSWMRHFLLAKILDTQAAVPLRAEKHVQQKQSTRYEAAQFFSLLSEHLVFDPPFWMTSHTHIHTHTYTHTHRHTITYMHYTIYSREQGLASQSTLLYCYIILYCVYCLCIRVRTHTLLSVII